MHRALKMPTDSSGIVKVRATLIQEVKMVMKHVNRYVVLFVSFYSFTWCSVSLLVAVMLIITIENQRGRFAGPSLVCKS